MIVPNYVPDPLEVPGNVADERYAIRLEFIRQVTFLHLAGVGLVAALTLLPWPRIGMGATLWLLAGWLLTLDLWRIWKRGQRIEATISATALPLTLLLVAWTLHTCQSYGWRPQYALAGLGCATVYTALCGRDFSFVGCTVLSLICSSVSLAAYAVQSGLRGSQAAAILAINGAYLIYFEYDLASLMSRRRQGEEIAALVDLYRDIFNLFGYVVRLIRHWKKHRIWA